MKTLILLIFSFILSTALLALPMEPVKFRNKFVHTLSKKQPSLKIEVEKELQLKVTKEDKEEFTLFLDNAYMEYKSDEGYLEETIKKYVNSFLETINQKDVKLDKDRIVPIIKDKGYIEEAKRSLNERGISSENLQYVFEAYNDSLVILYAEDTPNNIRYFNIEELKQINLSKNKLREVSTNNLNSILPKIELHGSDGYYMLTAGGDYEASLLLLSYIWEDKQIEVDGDYVIAIPARDVLLITGSRNRNGIKKLRKSAVELVNDSAYYLTGQLFIYKDQHFIEYN